MKTCLQIEPCRKVRLHRERMERLREKYVWDEEEAARAVRFIEGNIRHWKEPFTGKPFILSDWQKDDIIKPLWGLRRADGTRLFRYAYVQLPRKNGKSALAGAMLLLVLCTDGSGLELYTAATKRDQARIVFNDCVQFIRASPKLRKRLKIYQAKIVYRERVSVLMPLSSDYDSMDGLNVSAAVIDELHAHKSSQLHDVIVTATGARTQPLILSITTAGEGEAGVCLDQYEYGAKVLEGAVEADTYFYYVAEADKDLEWNDPAAYLQANPNYGVSVKPDYLEEQLQEAVNKPSYRKTWERYHLNRWVQSGADKWIDVEKWKRNAVAI